MAFEDIIEQMKTAGRFDPKPAYSSEDLDGWEKSHGMKLSDAFRSILTAGSYEIANFYFHPLIESADHPGFVLFAKWNDDEFGFKSDGTDPGVYTLLKGEEPFKKHKDFETWFRNIAELTARTNNPE